jgi:hypothetical protein
MNIGEWRFSFEIAWDDRWYKWQSIATMLLFIAGSVSLLWKMVPSGLENGLIVFHYNLYLGIDEVHHWAWIIVFLITALLVVLFDLIGSFRLYRHDKIASRILLCAATLFTILIGIAAFYIASVNT